MAASSSLDRFQGCLIGALAGDCLGRPFEGHCWMPRKVIPKDAILAQISPESLAGKKKGSMRYTDDTAMARCVSASLLCCKKFDAVDMATRFTEEFTSAPHRGYGGNVVDIFQAWKKSDIDSSNVLNPSMSQFNGSGSYGNGGAMRVAPVALFVNDVKQCIEVAKDSAFLTHSNRAGYIGAVLQALAVYKSLHSVGKINWKEYLKDIRNEIANLEGVVEAEQQEKSTVTDWLARCKRTLIGATQDAELFEWTRSDSFTFTKQLDVIEELLTAHFQAPNEYDGLHVVERLGRDVSAQEAVPAALYCFLRNLELGFVETIYYSISLGGDTDTIATMCAAMAGAYYGYSSIPLEWNAACESHDEVLEFANKFHELHSSG